MNATAPNAVVTPFTQNNNKQQKQTAKEVIAANVQALIEQLEKGHSEALTAYLTAMGRLHSYSLGNILEIARQKPDATRVAIPAAGSCVECPKRTGHNKLLFADVSGNADACTDPDCYSAKLDAHVKAKVAAKPELVQISTAYKQHPEGEKAIPRNKYSEIREEKPPTPEKAKWPEFKTCKYTTEAIVSDGIDKGELRKVCTEPNCPIHHPKRQTPKADANFKAEEEKRSREEGLANATGIRILQSIVAAVPVRLMKRDLLFVTEQLLPLLDEKRLEIVARN